MVHYKCLELCDRGCKKRYDSSEANIVVRVASISILTFKQWCNQNKAEGGNWYNEDRKRYTLNINNLGE